MLFINIDLYYYFNIRKVDFKYNNIILQLFKLDYK